MRIGKVVETECNDGISYSSPAITLCIVVEGYLVRLFIATGCHQINYVAAAVAPTCTEAKCKVSVFCNGHPIVHDLHRIDSVGTCILIAQCNCHSFS